MIVSQNTSFIPTFLQGIVEMKILQTPHKYFIEDITRAKNLVYIATDKGNTIGEETKEDLLRSAWMFAVGACDAYFCVAFGDLIARTYRAKKREPDKVIPDKLGYQSLTVNDHYKLMENGGWGWRNFARKKIEKESVLSLEELKDWMNVFLEEGKKILSDAFIENWILHKDCKQRLVGISATDYRNLKNGDKHKERKRVRKQIEDRFKGIFQRRHDCIHDCDRPKSAIQKISPTEVEKVIEDIEFLVNRCNELLVDEFPSFLVNICGFSLTTKNNVCG